MITLVQAQNAGSTGDSITATFDSPPAEGNLLVLAYYNNDSDATEIPVGWTAAVSYQTSTLADRFTIAYKIAGAAEPQAVTIDYVSETENSSLAIGEFNAGSGMGWPVDPVDVTEINNVNTATTSHSSGTTATTSQAEALAVAGWGLGGDVTGRGYTNSYTEIDYGTFSDTAAFFAYLVLSAVGIQESTASWNEETHAAAGIVVFVNEATEETKLIGRSVHYDFANKQVIIESGV